MISESEITLTAASAGPVAPSFLFAVPSTPPDSDVFKQLLPDARQQVLLTLARLKQIHESGNVKRECDRIAAGLKTILNGGRGTSASTLRRQYYAYTKYGLQDSSGNIKYHPGDWRCVVDWAKAGSLARNSAADALPPEFLSFWRRLCENHQRVTSEAYRELLNIWQFGFDFQRNRIKAIPGYSDWPKADPSTGRPFGWTQRNLYRHAPDSFERTAARIGIQAASQVGLKIRTTRAELLPLEHVEFDDHEFNLKLSLPGQMRTLRPRGFGAADALCSHLFSFVAKPTFYDEDEQAKKTLTETDFMWFVVSYLTGIGYRTDTGTILHVEHGTAAIREWLAQRISDLTAGKVTVAMSGRFHRPAHGGQLFAPSGGNFRFKPIIEGYWRMLDDRLDSLPGQVGKDRNHSPEESERRDAYMARLLKAAGTMTPERAAELILPGLTWSEFTPILHEKIAAINGDHNHSIEGWHKLKFFVREFRETTEQLEWKPAALLTNGGDHDLVTRVSQDDRLFRVRKMSRAEAFAYSMRKTAAGIQKLPPTLIPSLVGPRNALRRGEPLTVRNGTFEFEDWRIDPEPLVYLAQDDQGNRFREGEKFICYVNPMAPHCLIACDKNHRVISVCPPMPVAACNDQHAVQKSMGLQNSWYARALADQRARHETDAAALEFMRRHNRAILEGQQSPVEKQRARDIRKLNLDPESLIEGAAVPAAAADAEQDFNPESLL